MNETQAPSPNTEYQPDLGAALLSCRRVSGARTLSQAFLFGWLLYYILYPFIILPYLALMTAMLPFLILGYGVEDMMGVGFGIMVALLCVLFCWLVYVHPRGNHFVLHEKGIRIRSGFRRFQDSLESIEGIYVGRSPSKIEEGLRKTISLLKSKEVDWLNRLDGTAITVVKKDGTIHVFKALLTRFESADLEKLFQELVRRNPQLGAIDAEKTVPT